LGLLEDAETGYLHDGIIIRENEKMPMVMTADTIDHFLGDFKAGKIKVYLKTETSNPELVLKDGILQVYGSNFVSIVKERKFSATEERKGLILMFTRQNCPKCEWTEAYFDRLAEEFGSDDF